LRENQFKFFQSSDGLPEVNPRSLFVDSRGWLWVGLRYNGVSVAKNPQDDEPQFVNYSTEQGLVSDAVWFIAEDDFGKMYFATDRGLEQFDPSKNHWRHFNSNERSSRQYLDLRCRRINEI
jgi:ligand-binding sensor domain-containing protein